MLQMWSEHGPCEKRICASRSVRRNAGARQHGAAKRGDCGTDSWARVARLAHHVPSHARPTAGGTSLADFSSPGDPKSSRVHGRPDGACRWHTGPPRPSGTAGCCRSGPSMAPVRSGSAPAAACVGMLEPGNTERRNGGDCGTASWTWTGLAHRGTVQAARTPRPASPRDPAQRTGTTALKAWRPPRITCLCTRRTRNTEPHRQRGHAPRRSRRPPCAT